MAEFSNITEFPKSSVQNKTIPEIDSEIHEFVTLTDQLDLLLKKHKSTLDAEGMSDKVEILKELTKRYSNGLMAAETMAQIGSSWIAEISEHLKLAANESGRLENEGGPPPSKEQSVQTDDLNNVSRKLNEVAPKIE